MKTLHKSRAGVARARFPSEGEGLMALDDRLARPPTAPEPAAGGWFYCLPAGMVLRSGKRPAAGPEKTLWLETGRAFPLGHPTTRLCLDLLTGALAERSGKSLAEVGCGSGVICVAAAALGVPAVTAVDIDARAVLITRKNAHANGFGQAVTVVQGSPECLRGRFELVVANLPWDVQVAKAPELARLTETHGRLILSGFRDNQEEALLDQYRSLGRTLQRRLVKYFDHPELPPGLSFNWVAWLLS